MGRNGKSFREPLLNKKVMCHVKNVTNFMNMMNPAEWIMVFATKSAFMTNGHEENIYLKSEAVTRERTAGRNWPRAQPTWAGWRASNSPPSPATSDP